jgi:hypothetical protein
MPAMLLHIHSLLRETIPFKLLHDRSPIHKNADHTDSPRPEDHVQQRDRSCSFHAEENKAVPEYEPERKQQKTAT